MLQQMPAHVVGALIVLGQHDGVKLFLQMHLVTHKS